MEETITSAQNPKIKLLQELQQKSSMRRKHGLFVVEGRREVERCIQKGYRLDTVFVCPEISGSEWTGEGRVVRISPIIYNKVAYRGGTEGVIAEVATQEYRLHDLQLPNNPLVVVLESVEKPGNLGAVLRSADAAGVDAVIVCDPLCDLYHPNVIRSSTGAFFSVPCVACRSEECIAFLKEHGCEATAEEVAAFLKAKSEEDAPLSLDELENSAGGACNKKTRKEVGLSIGLLGVGCAFMALSSALSNTNHVGQRND